MIRCGGLVRLALAAGVVILIGGPASPQGNTPATQAAPAKPPPFQMRPDQSVGPAAEQFGPTIAPPPAVPQGPITLPVNAAVDRPILSAPDINLTGEADAVTETVYLSAAEAARPATLSIGMLSSVVVMPEASRLTVSINGEPVMAEPITSAGRARRYEVGLPNGVLRGGANRVRISVEQRHRVDCSVAATFELWSLLQPAITGLSFEGGPVALDGIADLPAVGLDDGGATRLIVFGPLLDGALGTRFATVTRVVSAAAVLGRFSHPVVEAGDGMVLGRRSPGRLAIVVGTAAAILPYTTLGNAEAQRGPTVAFGTDAATGTPVLVVSGPTPADLRLAVERLTEMTAETAYPGESGGRWRYPDAAVFDGGDQRTFAELGMPTQEFSGRRIAERFEFLLPADFYGANSGSARFLLDAAFTPEVGPGSVLNIRVNGQVSVSLRLAATSGGLFEQRRINLPMELFRPGLNRVELETVLVTEADRDCLPGMSGTGDDRFVLFESSIFQVPTFARFGNWPSLAAFAADAFPYDVRSGRPIGVYLGGSAMSAAVAATVLGRLSVDTGTPIAGELVPDEIGLADRPALIVAVARDVPATVKSAAGLSLVLDGEWRAPAVLAPASPSAVATGAFAEAMRRLEALQPAAAPAATGPTIDIGNPERTRALYEQWRQQVGEGSSGDVLQWIMQSMRAATAIFAFDGIGTGRVRLTPRTRMIVAQAPASPPTWRSVIWPSTAPAAWTLVTAPDDAGLASAIVPVTAPSNWQRLAGGVATYDEATGSVTSFAPAAVVDVATRPFSIENARLTSANWFSIHIAVYVWAVVVMALVVGTTSWMFIRRLGRRADP